MSCLLKSCDFWPLPCLCELDGLMVQSGLAGGPHCEPPEWVRKVFEQLWRWYGLVCRVGWLEVLTVSHQSGSGRYLSNRGGGMVWCAQAHRGQQPASAAPAHRSSPNTDWHAALCELDTAVLDGMFPVLFLPSYTHFTLPASPCNNRHTVKFPVAYWD